MNRTTRFLVVLLVAVGLASAAAYAVYQAVARLPVQRVEVGTVPVVVAARAVPVGTMLTQDDVKVVGWPAGSPIADGFDAIDKVVNRGAIRSLSPNEPVTESRLAPLGTGAGLPPTITPGMRAISVRVDEVVGVAGFVVPGTLVDVLVTVREGPGGGGSMSRAVVEKVQVLASGTRYDQTQAQRDGQPIRTSVVTLLVTPADAERIALAASEGKVVLTLRHPLDTLPSETTGIRLAGLMGAPSPPPVPQQVQGRTVMRRAPAPQPTPAPKPYTVEAIRAAKRTEEAVR